MPRQPVVPLTEEEKFKQQQQQEQELQCFQRQYNLLERDRQQYGLKLGRLNKILSIYKREHHNILTDLEVATSLTKKRQGKKDLVQLSKRLDDYDYFTDEVNRERKYIKEIDSQIKTVGKSVIKLRSMQVTDRHQEQRNWEAKKRLEGLMNKLDVQNTKFGTICAKNRAMKAEIRRMLWERDVFMKIWNKLINQLVLGKKFMTDLTEQATIAYDEREQWVSKLQALRIKAHHDFLLHSQEMRELKMKQDNNKKLEVFFNVKGQKRVMKSLREKQEIRRLERKTRIEEKLTEYKQYLEDILGFTGEERIKIIAQEFRDREARNFSLFNRVINMIYELEFMNDNLADLHDGITEKTIKRNLTSSRQEDDLKDMEIDLAIATKEVEDAKQELQAVEQYIQSMLSGIFSIFTVCKCNQDPVFQLLGDNTKINIYNYLFFLESVEKTVHYAILDVYNYEKVAFEKKKITGGQRVIYDDNLSKQLASVQMMADTNPCPLCIEHEMVSDVIDSVQHVRNRAQAREALEERKQFPEYLEHLHNLSKCFLPKSRELIQKRYM